MDPAARTDASRYRYLIEHIQDAVVEFELRDRTPVVVDVNRAFVDTFGHDRDAARGESLNDLIVPDWCLDAARALDERTAAGEVNYRRVKRETASGLREFLYRGIPLSVADERVDGFAVYTDLTRITRHQRRLQVLNRLLRHNLRNEVNVILGRTELLLDDPDAPDRDESLATVADAADGLLRLADEASDIDRVLNAPVDDPGIDCVHTVERTVADARRRFPSATITTDLPPSLEVRATGHLRDALDALVENAVEHNPAPEPRVRIRVAAAATDGWADVRVDDDGPRIPAEERRVVAGDAEITPVNHGSGLGLWLVRWVTESFGGEVRFETSDLGGNSVCLRLPR